MDPKTRLEEKRKVPLPIQKILAWDVDATKRLVAFLLNFTPVQSFKQHSRFLEVSCHGVLWIIGWFLFCWFYDNPDLYEAEINLMFGLIIDIIIVACVKAATRRRRPAINDDPFCIGPDQFSFPSGHATRAFLIATFFTALAPFPMLMWPSIWAWASSVAISRLLMYRHHIVDVVCGCTLGVLEALLLAMMWIEKDTARNIMMWISEDRTMEGQTDI